MDIPLTFKLEIKGTLEYRDVNGVVIDTVEFSTRRPIDIEPEAENENHR